MGWSCVRRAARVFHCLTLRLETPQQDWRQALQRSFKAGEQDTKTKNHKKTKDNKETSNKEAKHHDKETKDDKKADDFKETKDDKGTKGVEEETKGSKEIKRQEAKKGA